MVLGVTQRTIYSGNKICPKPTIKLRNAPGAYSVETVGKQKFQQTTDSCSMSVLSQDESIASENASVFLKSVSRLEKHSSAKTLTLLVAVLADSGTCSGTAQQLVFLFSLGLKLKLPCRLHIV